MPTDQPAEWTLPADPVEAAKIIHRLTDGLIVSVDVSTGEHDYAARVYGRIVGAQGQADGTGSPMLLAEFVERVDH